MSAYESDLSAVQDDLPDNILSVEGSGQRMEVTLLEPMETFEIILSDGYQTSYPAGELTALINGNYVVLQPGLVRNTVEQLRDKVNELGYTGPDYDDNDEEMDSNLDSSSDALAGGPSMDMCDFPAHSQFLADLQAFKDMYGNDAVTTQEIKMIDTVVCTLNLDYSFLSNAVCNAWGLAPKKEKKPLKIKVTFSRTGYTDAQKYQVECYQDGATWCGVAGQLQRVLKDFFATVWKEKKALDEIFAQERLSPDMMTLMELGFPEAKARQALDICGSAEHAATYLFEGQIPPGSSPKASKSQDDTEDEITARKQRIPPRRRGLLVQIMEYAQHRIPTFSEFCVICDKHHVFASHALLKSSVCSREMCAFAFQQLGVGSDAAEDIATDVHVADLLVSIAKAAANSNRWKIIFNPYPTLFDPADATQKILHPSKKDIDKVRRIINSIPSTKVISQGRMKDTIQVGGEHSYSLLQWIMNSNTSHLIRLSQDERVSSMSTPHQFLMVSASPAKQAQFDALKKKHKSIFAFHGSALENWHSILRNGLYNASGTEHQVNGAAYGSGIYLSPSASVSYGYSQLQVDGNDANKGYKESESQDFMGGNLSCVAVCEVIDVQLKRHGDIWVQPVTDHVVTRFFFVFDSKHRPDKYLNTETDSRFKEELTRALEYSERG
eukprot:TRINITY_DN4979_c2_g1_i2.p1 TRINITY_DN4979_c2_g1~~TRINITY_DN4979_c2_g1_i2.p1  ORF type:complete len:666 (+),score=126.41 TRINITY_DN4979_c2_g1_i2:72-2069(+)